MVQNKKTPEEQFHDWEAYSNGFIGTLAFSLAIGSLGTSSPSINAFISLLFAITLFTIGPFPTTVTMLRTKGNRTLSEERARRTLESQNIGLYAILTRYTVCVLGLLSLAFVIALDRLGDYFPAITHYIYG